METNKDIMEEQTPLVEEVQEEPILAEGFTTADKLDVPEDGELSEEISEEEDVEMVEPEDAELEDLEELEELEEEVEESVETE